MHTEKEIQDWLVLQVAALLQIDPGTVNIDETFSGYGLSSLDAVTLSGDLEAYLGRRLSPTLAYDYPSVAALSRYLAGGTEKASPAPQIKSPVIDSPEPIAVIGLSCRFPGADSPEAFWQLLRNGVDAITEVPKDRWNRDAFYHPDGAVPGKSVSRWGGFLDSFDQFDPFFFRISPAEAKHMDPQQRMLLELSSEALDDTGRNVHELEGSRTGVFIGISVNEYSQLLFGDPAQITAHSGTGAALSVAANRISYVYNFHGPSMAVDTACSSSLAAVHLACQSLRRGECTMALAGGVNMILSPAHSVAFTKAGVLAPDGRCKTFDSKADGYVRGEGGGIIVLKPLSSALADGDPVQVLLLGSAILQDGRTNGLMAPSGEAQEELLRQAYQAAGVPPGSVHYVEAHGTGTVLGDAIEAGALGAVIGAHRSNGTCAIGSVKTNIGHLESAAGIAGLIKVILSLKNRAIPPSIHYQTPNPHIPFDSLNLRVNNLLEPWPSCSGPRLAGVSSFGFGGTNVHLVVQEAPGIAPEEKKQDHLTNSHDHLLPLSAQDGEALKGLASAFQKWLLSDPSVSISNICSGAGARRSQHSCRLAVVGQSREELSSSLQAFLNGEKDPHLFTGGHVQERQPRMVFVFPGQGGQWLGMGRDLLKQETVFRDVIQQIDNIIQARFSWSLLDILCSDHPGSCLDQISVVQPALFTIQVALSSLWQSWGIKPDAVIGHSMGEIAAAHVAGILTLEDAVQIVCRRSQLLKTLQGHGRMLATELTPGEAEELLKCFGSDVSIAVINSPASTVISGSIETMEKIKALLESQHRFCKPVNVDVASHSSQMDALHAELLQVLSGLHPQPFKIPIYSTVTGGPGDHLSFGADYWFDNLRKPVLFSGAVNQLLQSGHSIFIELGPHPVLLGSIQQAAQPQHRTVRLLPSLRRGEPAHKTMLQTLATLYTDGFSIAWNKLYPSCGTHVHLPLVPWQRQRYWLDTPATGSKSTGHGAEQIHPLLGLRIDLANASSSFVWQTTLDETVLHLLEHHQVENETVFPAAGYIEMALQGAKEAGFSNGYEVCDFIFKERMIFQRGKARIIQSHLSPGDEGHSVFTVYSRAIEDKSWVLHASAKFQQNQSMADATVSGEPEYKAVCEQSTHQYTPEAFYQRMQSFGLQYGPAFQGLQKIWRNDRSCVGLIILPKALQQESNVYRFHPALLDACLQVVAAIPNASIDHTLYLPTGCRMIRFCLPPGNYLWSQVTLNLASAAGSDGIDSDIRLFNNNGEKVAELIGFRLQRVNRRKSHLPSVQNTWFYRLQWQPKPDQCTLSNLSLEGKHWLILADDQGLGEELASQIEKEGGYCHLWHCRDAVQELNGANSDSLFHYIEKRLKEISSPIDGIVHLWSLSAQNKSLERDGSSNEAQFDGCESTLALVHALARRITGTPRLWLVTRGAQPVKDNEPVAVEQSSLWGLGKVTSFELPEFACIRIDLDPAQSNRESADLLAKAVSVDDREDQLAFRDGVRYVHRLLPFLHKALFNSPGIPFSADSSYLITGGLGGLGLKTAEWMVQQGAKHLVLIGRREPTPEAASVVEQLRQHGVNVVVEQIDVSDFAQLQDLINKIEVQMPALRGVIHAAGVLDDGALLNLDHERMRKVMAPKVAGTWNLHQATAGLPLDFFVLFSSAVSVLGSPGQGNYAAASAFLDAFSHYRRSLGLPAISINWGPWADVGLAAEATEKLNAQHAPTEHLIKVIQIEEGLRILGHLLSEATPQVMVLPFDLKNLVELYPTAAGLPFLAEVGGSKSHTARLYARPNLRQPYLSPANEMERKLVQLWQQTLHIDRVGVHDSFFELGGDSVLAAQVLTSVQKVFGIRLDPQETFKAFTIKKLAEMLEEQILQKIEKMSEEEVQQLLAERRLYDE